MAIIVIVGDVTWFDTTYTAAAVQWWGQQQKYKMTVVLLVSNGPAFNLGLVTEGFQFQK